jgi:hypothetical protein
MREGGTFSSGSEAVEAVHIVWLYLAVFVDSMFIFVSDHHHIISSLLAFCTTEHCRSLQTGSGHLYIGRLCSHMASMCWLSSGKECWML